MISRSPEKDFKQNPNSEQQHVQSVSRFTLGMCLPALEHEVSELLQSGIKPGKSKKKIREKSAEKQNGKKKKKTKKHSKAK